jgi:hypothetical protein
MKSTIGVSVSLFTLSALLSTPVAAQESDAPCYLRTGSGQIVNLTRLCGGSGTIAAPPTPNSTFISDFQTLAKQYPTEVSQALDRYLSRDRDRAIAAAKATCRVLKLGGPQAEAVRQKALAARDPSAYGKAQRQITSSLAIAHYCPEFAVR